MCHRVELSLFLVISFLKSYQVRHIDRTIFKKREKEEDRRLLSLFFFFLITSIDFFFHASFTFSFFLLPFFFLFFNSLSFPIVGRRDWTWHRFKMASSSGIKSLKAFRGYDAPQRGISILQFNIP